MALEIERKFLIDTDKLGKLENGYDIKQGYIQTKDETVIRVRVKGNGAFVTIKGGNIGATRLEYEYAIPVEDANEMLEKFCTKPILYKTRYLILHKKHTWEIDIFHKEIDGLIVAEADLDRLERRRRILLCCCSAKDGRRIGRSCEKCHRCYRRLYQNQCICPSSYAPLHLA
jgi:adenylate cyclase